MAKRKPKAPSVPPQSLSEALLAQAVSEVTDKQAADFASFVIGGSQVERTKRQNQDACQAVMALANLGWAYYCYRMREAAK